MSGSGADVVRAMYAGFSELAGGADVGSYVRAHFDPQIEYRPVEEGEPIRGHEAMIAWNERWFEAWEEVTADVDEIAEDGDVVFSAVTIRGRGVGSGAAVELRVFHRFEFRASRILRMSESLERDQTLADRPR